MPPPEPDIRDLLRLTLTPGLGPTLSARAVGVLGSVDRVLGASPADLQRVRGIGPAKAAAIAEDLRASSERADQELAIADRLGVDLVPRGDERYPPLLDSIPDPPPLLYVLGRLDAAGADRYPVAIVGSRRCTSYGIEQAERFAGVLARSGLTIVSGGARGIDSAAHRGAMRAGGRTIAILGCGLAQCYPPENKPLFDQISEGSGAVISELPLRTSPSADNFPARNRIISGLSLGVLVIEAGRRSGALITARQAAEDHGREVMVVPGRVDSPASEGALELLKRGGGNPVTDPSDVLQLLESPARHLHGGTHAPRFADPAQDPAKLFENPPSGASSDGPGVSDTGRLLLKKLAEPMTLDELAARTQLEPALIRSELTLLELQGRVRREAGRIVATARSR